jgi:catechol 2,3-dioxygenase-like lactoylglutathione lyase family enzyme
VANEHERGKHGTFSVHDLRYQVTDVARAAAFYTAHLGFNLEHQQLPAFASVSLGEFTLLVSGPGASGSRSMPDGESQEPGGWNRVVLRVSDLPAQIDALKKAGVKFRIRWRLVRAADRSRWKIPTEIRSNSSSRRDRRTRIVDDSGSSPCGEARFFLVAAC